MHKILSWPVRVHLLLLVILLALPSIALIVYWGVAARDEAIEDAKSECLKFVNAVAGEQQAVVAGVRQLTATLALLPEVQSRNAPAADAFLSELLKKNPLYSSIGISDTSGSIWASATPYEGTISVADRKYFRDAVRSGAFSSGEFSVGRVVKRPVINFAQPVMNASNELTGVIAVSLNLEHIQSLFEKINLPAGSSFSLLDHRGIILHRNSQDAFSEQLVGKPDIREELFIKMVEGPDEGTYEAMGNDGKVRLTAYKKLRLPHESQPYLYIRSSIPKTSIVSKANTAMLGKMAALASVFAVGLMLALFIGKRMIVDPITKLKEVSRQLAAGPAPVNVSEQVKDGELGELAHAFDDMAEALLRKEEAQLAAEAALREANELLEQRVRERTRALQHLTEQLEGSRGDLRRLASELVMAEERERKRIAGVLHDDIAQILATVRMRLDLLGGLPSDQQETLKDAKALLLQSIQETRTLMTDIGNPLLFDMGLKAACESLAKRLMDRHAVRIRCDIRDAYKHLNPDVKTILFQVIRELLNNVVKHSEAQNAHVTIDMDDGHFSMKVTDDGAGFDPQMLGAPTVDGGFGLYSIRERLIAIGGSLRIESAPGTGTVVTAILPAALD